MPEAKPKRYLRNYLIDARFQLKLTLYAVGATLVVVALLGTFLWSTTQELFRETESAVEARSKAAETSKELGNVALSQALLEKFNDPTFATKLQEQSTAIDKKYDAEKAAILGQYQQLRRNQQMTLWVLVGGLLGFVIFVGFGAILTTHKIVGPLFRFRRMAHEVSEGHLRLPTYGLRQGDEFKDVFESLAKMIQYLRDCEEGDIRKIQDALARAEGQAAAEPLTELAKAKQRRLDG